MTSKIIFVDIDGVLLPLKDWTTPENSPLLKTRPSGFMQHLRFNREAVTLLVRLADLAGAKLVLSSNWRITWGPDADAIMRKLVAEGLRADLWHEDWYLPVLGIGGRKFDEIADWISDHSPCRALIIDDEEYTGPRLPAGVAGVIIVNEHEGYSFNEHPTACSFFGVEETGSPQGDEKSPVAPSEEQPAEPSQSLVDDPYAPEREASIRGEPRSCMPMGQYLGQIGCMSFPPGQSVLWFRGDSPDQGRWLFAIASPKDGPASPGYRIILTYGREKAGSIKMEACILLRAEDRQGNRVVFDKGCLVRHEGGKFLPDGYLDEAEAVGRVSEMEFGPRPYHFAA